MTMTLVTAIIRTSVVEKVEERLRELGLLRVREYDAVSKGLA